MDIPQVALELDNLLREILQSVTLIDQLLAQLVQAARIPVDSRCRLGRAGLAAADCQPQRHQRQHKASGGKPDTQGEQHIILHWITPRWCAA